MATRKTDKETALTQEALAFRAMMHALEDVIAPAEKARQLAGTNTDRDTANEVLTFIHQTLPTLKLQCDIIQAQADKVKGVITFDVPPGAITTSTRAEKTTFVIQADKGQ